MPFIMGRHAAVAGVQLRRRQLAAADDVREISALGVRLELRSKVMGRRLLAEAGFSLFAWLAVSAAVCSALTSLPAGATEWPTKTVRVIVPFAAGSATDLVPRAVFEGMSAQLGHSIVIDNRIGGGTTVGASAVAKADPDGHTILVHSNALVTVPAIQPNVPYDPVRDFSSITTLGAVPLVLVISPEKNIRTVQQLVSIAKEKPGTINYAAAGIGTPPHLTTERFRLAAGFEGQLVPFKGAPEAVTEVLAGRVDFYFCPLPAAISFITDGKLLPLAVSSAKRVSALPDVPTTLEAGFPDSDFDFWVGALVPKQTPRDLVARMHAEIAKSVESSSVKEKLSTLGVEPMVMSPEDFDARIAKEAGIAMALAKAAHIRLQ
jgi:tripartite-type tricarboxylate transporter receptor subunit TctC